MDIAKMRSALVGGLVALSLFVAPLHAQQTIGTGAFPDTGVLEQQLKRGVSTKADVQRLLGVPNGMGKSDMVAVAPVATAPLGQGSRDIWYYDDLEVTEVKSEADVIRMNLRQQILLVFFKGEFFDGYLWTSNAFKPEGFQSK